HAVEAGEQHRREREICIARRIRRTKLKPLQLRIRREHRNTNRRRAVASGVREIHRRFETRHESFVTVRRRRSKSHHRRRMLQQAADVITCEIRKPGVTVAAEEWLLTFPQRLVTVHSRTVIAVQWLRHERRGFSELVCSIANYVFKDLKIISRSQKCGIAKIDLTLTGSRNFVVMTFDSHATLRQSQRNLRAQIS